MTRRYKKDAKAGQAQRLIAESFWEQEDHENAWKSYSEVRNFTDDKESVYQAEYNAGRTAYLLNKITEGMATFKRLADNKDYYSHLAEIKLELARGHLFSGQVEQAVKLNEEIITAYPKTPQSAQAYYQLGIIQQDYKDDLKAAKENFDKAKDEKPGSDYSKKALEKSADITKLEEYRKQLTEGEAEKSVETQFLLAEFYLIHMNKPDSALATYKNIAADHPQSEFAPKALLAMAYICSEVKDDSVGCRQACEELIKNYPATDYALTASRILDQEPAAIVSPSAATLFYQAEEQLFTRQNPDSASRLYQAVIDSFPGSVYVPRAMLGKALILEQTYQVTTPAPDTSALPDILSSPIQTDSAIAVDTSAATSLVNDSVAADTAVAADTSSLLDSSVVAAVSDTSGTPVFDSTVYLAYKSILDKYPDSEAARVAQLKLGLKERPKPKPVPEKKPQSPADSLAALQVSPAPTQGDTVDTLVQGLPLAPEPISKGTFVYPPELIPEQISGYVYLKMEIDYFSGEVRRLDIMQGSIENEEIRRRVRQVMEIAKFDTTKLNPAYLESLYGYRFKIIPPPITTQ
jgi:TolA-binding protein